MQIKIMDIIQSNKAYSSELGLKVRDAYGDSWQRERLILDFDKIINASPSFLSQATMPILMGSNLDEIANQLEFRNPPSKLEENWQRVVDAIRRQRQKAS
jgi:hypothetical protein